MKLRILITNDDGIYSPGLLALAKIAAGIGEVRIVAPDIEQSSMGQAITSSRPVNFRRVVLSSFEAYRVNGTPSDCVALGASQWDGVDVVFSGINMGLNLGNSCWHSGTLAAARQAALLGLRGVAVSAPVMKEETGYDLLAPHVEEVLKKVLAEKNLPLVNINLPVKPHGMEWTRMSVRHYDGKVVPQTDPMGRIHYWYTVVPIEGAEPGTDRKAMESGNISITPLRLDLTDEHELVRLQGMNRH